VLNRAARFFPILQELKHQLPADGELLEVGSGSLGLGEFWNRSFVGCDVSFTTRPVNHMRAVMCSGAQLPFRDRTFDAVVVSDVMEHVAPVLRKTIVDESLRVSRRLVLFGYPCGQAASELDRKLYRDYHNKQLVAPAWLEEHMLHPFPDDSLFAEVPVGWTTRVIPNESLSFHYWMMRTEMFRSWNYAFRLTLRMAPGLVEKVLQFVNREPSYRKLFVLTRITRLDYA
jgi:hypothetical protein